ncbi:DUF4365 domain-containing protein [Kribbella sp. CA-294648]|uniref:DUF4365 domain-containing protein n=1 Tax=Kribbella sp. CA-294648 TaxID=3239948 RepID=UPI003D925E64
MGEDNDNDANTLQGEFGETWLRAVAAGSNLAHGPGDTRDLIKWDVGLTKNGEVNGTYCPTVWAQVKTTQSLRRLPDGTFAYDLDIKTYDLLRRTNHATRRVLVVIEVRDSADRIRLEEHGTLLVGEARWTSLEGKSPTTNTGRQVVYLPAENTVDPPGLHRMLETYGVNRTTPVPDVDPWEER